MENSKKRIPVDFSNKKKKTPASPPKRPPTLREARALTFRAFDEDQPRWLIPLIPILTNGAKREHELLHEEIEQAIKDEGEEARKRYTKKMEEIVDNATILLLVAQLLVDPKCDPPVIRGRLMAAFDALDAAERYGLLPQTKHHASKLSKELKQELVSREQIQHMKKRRHWRAHRPRSAVEELNF